MRTVATYPAVVGAVLGILRRSRNISQAQMAMNLGMTQSAWSRIERGGSAMTLEQLYAAARTLNMTPSQILQYADGTANQLKQKGANVVGNRTTSSLNQNTLTIGAAALGAFAGAVLANKMGDNE